MKDIEKYKVLLSFSIKKAVGKMDEGGIGFCVCVDNEDNVVGVISDGDFRRAVLRGQCLDDNVGKIMNGDFFYVSKNYSRKDIEEIFLSSGARHIPVLDNGVLIDICAKEEMVGGKVDAHGMTLDNSVVIMAGGKGTRMDPFTRILPKPLIPVGNDPVIKVIMDSFGNYGIKNFHISLNEKGRMVKAYFHDHELPYNIQYVEEEKPLGTAGALINLIGKLDSSFFVSNCDVIIHADYASISDFHIQGGYDLTLVASMRHYTIPHGVCSVGYGGDLKGIQEKPEYDFLVNTGLYLLEPAVLTLIPDNQRFDMPDLINKIMEHGLRVGVFPVSEKSWADVGQWRDYSNFLNDFRVTGLDKGVWGEK
jgi:dTDP-glucose pyrophosphorylase